MVGRIKYMINYFEMHCERKCTLISHNTSYYLIEVVTKADLTVSYIWCWRKVKNNTIQAIAL
jgi:hypothetical protein